MSRIFCIDYGDVRTGLAISDPLGIIAVGIGTVKAEGDRKLISLISEELKKYDDIEIIVVGNPINMDGSRGPRSEKATAFAAKLTKATGIETVLYDERLSTMNAHRIMNDTNTRGQKRKDTVDTLSAQLILQSYMDLHKKR